MRKIAYLFIALTCFVANAQHDKPERSGFILRVPRNATQTYVQQVNPGPYFAMDKTLQLYPGEKVYVEIEIKSDTVFSMKTVEKILNPDRTLEIEFCQTIEKNTAKPTNLWVKNPVDRSFNMTILLYSIEDSAWRQSQHKLKPKWTTGIVWKKEVVGSLVLKDWTLE